MLERFQLEVLDLGPSACLPRNLSDYWLRELQKSVEVLLTGQEQEGASASGAMAAVLTLLEAKSNKRRPAKRSMPLEEFNRLAEDLRLELALEENHRLSDIKYEPATLETIFTNRSFRTWREGAPRIEASLRVAREPR